MTVYEHFGAREGLNWQNYVSFNKFLEYSSDHNLE